MENIDKIKNENSSLKEIEEKFNRITKGQKITQSEIKKLKKDNLNLPEQLYLKNLEIINLMDNNETDKALREVTDSIKISEDNRMLNFKAIFLKKLAILYYRKSEYNKYLKQMIEFVKLAEVIEPEYFKKRYYDLALAYINNRRLKDAEQCIHKSIALSKDYDEIDILVDSLNCLGEIHLRKNNVIDAQIAFKDALKLIDRTSSDLTKTQLYLNYGILLKIIGEFDTSVRIFNNALKIAKQNNNKRSIGVSYFNIAICYRYLEKFQPAIENYLKAEEIFDEMGNIGLIKQIYNNIAIIYEITNQNDLAIEYFQKAYQLADKMNDVMGKHTTRINILEYKIDNLQYSQEEKQELEEHIDFFKKEGNELLLVKAQKVLAEYHYHNQNYKESADIYNDSILKLEKFYKKQLKEKTQDTYHIIHEMLGRSEKKELILDEELVKDIKHQLIGNSSAIQEVVSIAQKAASIKNTNVLITGESGTGKEILSRLIHFSSERKAKKLVTVNCSAITTTLAESEFFGHVKGSFTGAINDKTGFFEQADGGTLYLDEIGDMPMEIQSKLLRTIESGTIIPVGSESEIKVDVRIVASTNKDLSKMIKENLFRLDLMHRINVISINIPPLRERGNDLMLLIDYFVEKLSKSLNKRKMTIDESYYTALSKYNFPGNIRELKNIVERSLIIENSNILKDSSLPVLKNEDTMKISDIQTFDLAEVERRTVLAALKAANNSQKEAAKLVGLSPSAFSRKLRKFTRNLE